MSERYTSRTDLDAIDLAPYKWMIQNEHPAMIMTIDVVTTAIDPDMPAELSQKVVAGVLGRSWAYDAERVHIPLACAHPGNGAS